MEESLDWASLAGVVLLCWLAIAIAVGTLVGHGISSGAESDAR